MTRSLWLALPLAALVACNGDDPDTDTDTGTDTDVEEAGDATLRVVHASPDAPAVDVFVQEVDSNLFSDLGYGETTDYGTVPAGTYNVEVRPAGTEDAAWTGELTVAEDATYTIVAAGLVGGQGEEAFRVLPLEESFAEPPGDEAVVRVVHASANAPEVDIDVGDDGQSELTLDTYADSGAAGVPLPSGDALQLGIYAGNDKVTAFTTPALPAGADVFVIATGVLGPDPDEADAFSLLAVGPDGSIGFIQQNPIVYALHASPDAPAVDVAAGDDVLGSGLAFGDLSGIIQVPPGTYTLDIHASPWDGSSAPVTDFDTPDLVAGGTYVAIATGFMRSTEADDKLRVLALQEAFDVAEDKVGLRAVHASPDAPAVDIGTVSGGTLTPVPGFTNVSFPVASGAAGVVLDPGTVDLGIAATGNTTPLFTFSGVELAAGAELIAVAAGEVGGGDNPFELIVVDTSASPWGAARLQPE